MNWKQKIIDYIQWQKTKKIVLPILIVACIGGVFFAAYEFGFVMGSRVTKPLPIKGAYNIKEKDAVDFTTFWEAWSLLKQKSVFSDKANDNTGLLYGAIQGLVGALGDNYSNYFPPQDAKSFEEEISGEFSGIGAELGLDEHKIITIIAPMKNSPAERAGMLAGDKVIKIDGESALGITTDVAVKKIRGKQGTIVKLSLLREGWREEKEFVLTREVIQVPALDYYRLNYDGKQDVNGPLAYVKIYNFYEKTPQDFFKVALQAYSAKCKGMIIDVRNNPGGYLDAAVLVSGWFVKKGDVVVQEEYKDKQNNKEHVARGPALFVGLPVGVLINKGSASASEIVAGALKERAGAFIMGEKSFGKGTVQELVPLADGSLVKITIAHWLTPDGHMIDKNGIAPDLEIKESVDSASSTKQTSTYAFASDDTIKKAAQELKNKIQK